MANKKDDQTTKASTRIATEVNSRAATDSKAMGFFESFFSFENLRSLAVLIVIVIAVRWSIASPYHVPTASMEPTIKVGDRLLAWKLAYGLRIPFTDYDILKWGSPKPGDIIVFKSPADPSVDYVKRVVGIPGDRLRVTGNVLYRNGSAQELISLENEREILRDISDNPDGKKLFREKLEGHDHLLILNADEYRHSMTANWPQTAEDYIVPADGVFVVGDNRDNSNDSRIWGHVPYSYIRGRAVFVLWSWFTDRTMDEFLSRFGRFGHILE